MSACEKCWTRASHDAARFGGVAADHYARVLREHDAEHGSQEQTMNEPTLTDTERDVEALADWLTVYLGNHTLPANYAAPLYGQTHHQVARYAAPTIAEDLLESDWLRDHVAARVAEAVDRERAAWATKIETLAGRVEARRSEFSPDALADFLRGLLAADDIEGKL